MNLNANQQSIRERIEYYASLLGVDSDWACAIAMVESSLGEHRVSPTNCRGIFQMSSIAMEDLRLAMGANPPDDLVEILPGLLFLRLLRKRHGSIEEATRHYCDPADLGFYLDRMNSYRRQFAEDSGPVPAAKEQSPSANKIVWWKRLF